MASCFNNHNEGPDPNAKLSTTFVQADPSNFRSVVQKLTGSTFQQQFTSTHKLPISNPSGRQAKKPALCEVGHHHISVHKLHERRKDGRKLEITLKSVARDDGDEMVMSSPVSTLDGRGSLGTPVEEEEKAIAEKGYYLHPSRPISIRGSEPQLLALFPLNSPKYD
uniref:VQ motif-containing protein 11-like n=1 Tax=Erigeron canadensis TaxID=72917 RepID=UPI001CB9032C|nr:VQ motif-containing protein 11-like [Erigeron canadensis]